MDAQGNQLNSFVALAEFATPSALQHVGGVYWRYAPGAGTIYAGVAGVGNGVPTRKVGEDNTLRVQSLETQPVLSPSREDRDRYPDALDPTTVLPAQAADLQAPFIAASLVPPDGIAGKFQLQFVGAALRDDVPGERPSSWL